MRNESALVLLSGGQDSATCLAWALDNFEHVETIGFDYGQRHRVELECRVLVRHELSRIDSEWRKRLQDDHVIDLTSFAELSQSALTGNIDIEENDGELPNTFVPGRNLVFLTYAAALAHTRKIVNIVGGMCETDFSGYPDCRDDAIKALQVAVNIGMESRFDFHTPLMWLNKAETWQLSHSIGGEALNAAIIEHSHTCYLGDRGARHEWGYGCGECPACKLRANGFVEFQKQRVSGMTMEAKNGLA